MGNLKSYPSSPRKKYDVFVNFRGKDTRDCFTSHLYHALRRNQIEAFIDYRLRVGDEILPGLMEAINESKISVVIFSEDYATSKWCLRELVEILKCKNLNNQIVIPVFYRVDPSDVRHQTGIFKDPFVEHEKISQKEVKTWTDALAEACGIKGWHSSVGRTDAELVNEIVNDIWKKLMSEYVSPDFGKLIGLAPRIEQIMSLLYLKVTTDVRIIGIWGMGGIGKTTLADAIFNQNKNQFEGVCFIKNVRERLEKCGGLDYVKEEILSKVLKDGDLKLDSLTIPPKIKERLNRLKVFIVLDDVDDSLNVETLVQGVDGLGQGSRIIITSRDKHVLRNCHVNDDNIYEVKGFDRHEALQLFCKYAFQKNCHSEDPMVKRLVNFANGNPLALKVLGSSLYKKNKEEWETVVNKFEPTNLNSKIFDVLKISYDGLNYKEKNIFLDIACFLKGRERDYVAKILNNCQYSLSVLINKSLITISSRDTIEMHDLLEEMGRDIVNKESPNKIGKRSRLWRQEDVLCTLENDVGTPEVQGIFLDMFEINKDIHLSPKAFKKMYNLRLLKFHDSTCSIYSKVNFSEGLSVLSNKLRSLIWYGYPLQTLPSNFNPNNLVELDLRGSNLERLWEDCMDVPKLRWLNLSGCTRVKQIPDLSNSPLLESISLRDCNSLRSFPSGIHFESLRSLDLSNCNNLTNCPHIYGNNIRTLDLSGTAIKELHHSFSLLNGLVELFLGGCENLETFPSGICNLPSLRHLDLSDCSRLEILPENLGNLKSLRYLSTKRAAIKELPDSIAHLNGLEELFLGGCENLETLPSGICNLPSLRHLDLSDCSRLEILPEDWGNLKSLMYLSVDRIAIFQLPSFVKQFEKFSGRITHSSGLWYPRCSLRRLFLSDCNLNYIPKDIGCLSSLVELDLSVNNFDSLPQNMMDLQCLRFLHLDNCNGIVSLIDLPPNLTHLSACDCKQLQSIPSELAIIGLTKVIDDVNWLNAPKTTNYKRKPAEFIFTNCMNLEETAVSNMLARLVKYRLLGCTNCIFCYPGSEVPKWFRYTAERSSIKFQDTFDWKLKGFAVCTVIAFEKYLFNGDSQHKLGVHFDGTCSYGDQSSLTNIMSETAYVASRNRTLIDSDHVAFGYCDVSNHWLLGRPFKNFSFEFRLSEEIPNCRVKSCGVCPIYEEQLDEASTCDLISRNWNPSRLYSGVCPINEEELCGVCPIFEEQLCGVCPIYEEQLEEASTSGSRFDEEEMEPHPKENENLQTVKYVEPIEHIGETSGIRRRRTSNDHLEEEVQPHPKRLNTRNCRRLVDAI